MKLRRLLFFRSEAVTPHAERLQVVETTRKQKEEADQIVATSVRARNNNHFGPRIAAVFDEAQRRKAC